MLFYTAGEDQAGGLWLSYTNGPKYWLVSCSKSYNYFPTSIPYETGKILTVTLTRTSGTVRVTILCNNKEILNVVLSDTTCSDSGWSTIWSRDVEKIQFVSQFTAKYTYDTASDYYRPGKQVKFVSCLLPILL